MLKLKSISHPNAGFWNWIWFWLFGPKDINPDALEVVEVEIDDR